MKKIIVVVSLLSIIPSICFADFSSRNWKYYKEISKTSSGLVRFSIDDEIFANTESDLRDLRILSSKNKEVPYKLIVGAARTEVAVYHPPLLNNSYVSGSGTSAILDFGGNNSPVNSLTINTRSDNFQRNVMVYGSDNKEDWRIVKENIYIYDYTDKKAGFKSQNTAINFPESVFRYLKIEINDPANEPVIIDSVSARQYKKENAKELTRDPEFTIKTAEGSTEIIADMGSGGIPVGKIALNAKGANFNRGVTIYSSYNQAAWRSLGQSYIFRYDTPKFKGENLTLNFSETKDRFIKIVIANKDDEPLHISGVKTFSIFRQVVFNAEAEESYRVYYGNPEARLSEYDLEKYFQYLETDKADEATLSGQQKNKEYASARPATEKEPEPYPYFAPIALIIVSFLLLFLIYKFFQKK